MIGLLAAAEGRRRSDSVEDLVGLRFGVRIDQPGTVTKDFQTAIDWRTGHSKPLVSRYYLADAVFVAGIEGPHAVLEGIADALKRPRFPLFLGRRSCPANADLLIGIRESDLISALHDEPWQAAAHYRRTRPRTVDLPVLRDGRPGEVGTDVQDVPVNYAQEHREYAWRTVVHDEPVRVDNALGTGAADGFFETVVTA